MTAATAVSASCFGAESGPSVILDNYLDGYGPNRPIYYQTVGNLAAGPDFYVQVLGGPDAAHLQPIPAASTQQITFPLGTGLDGRRSSKQVTLTGSAKRDSYSSPDFLSSKLKRRGSAPAEV